MTISIEQAKKIANFIIDDINTYVIDNLQDYEDWLKSENLSKEEIENETRYIQENIKSIK